MPGWTSSTLESSTPSHGILMIGIKMREAGECKHEVTSRVVSCGYRMMVNGCEKTAWRGGVGAIWRTRTGRTRFHRFLYLQYPALKGNVTEECEGGRTQECLPSSPQRIVCWIFSFLIPRPSTEGLTGLLDETQANVAAVSRPVYIRRV